MCCLLQALLFAKLEVANPLLSQVAGDELNKKPLREASSREHASGGLLKGSGLDSLCNKRDPGMEHTVPQAAKGFTKRHVSNDVEGSKVCSSSMSTEIPSERGFGETH